MPLFNWLTKVANDPIRQGAGADNVVGVGCNEDRWNRVARTIARFSTKIGELLTEMRSLI